MYTTWLGSAICVEGQGVTEISRQQVFHKKTINEYLLLLAYTKNKLLPRLSQVSIQQYPQRPEKTVT